MNDSHYDKSRDAFSYLMIGVGLLVVLLLIISYPEMESKSIISLKEDYCISLGGMPDHASFAQFLLLDAFYVSCSFKKDEFWTRYEVVEVDGVFGLE